MKTDIMYNFLYDYCRMNQTNAMKDFLYKHSQDIDVLFEEGILFHIAIAQDMQEMLIILLEHYKNTKLQDNPETFEYKFSKHNLLDVLKDAVDSCSVSEGIQKILHPYIGDKEYSDEDVCLENMICFDQDVNDDTTIESSYERDSFLSSVPLTNESLKLFTHNTDIGSTFDDNNRASEADHKFINISGEEADASKLSGADFDLDVV